MLAIDQKLSLLVLKKFYSVGCYLSSPIKKPLCMAFLYLWIVFSARLSFFLSEKKTDCFGAEKKMHIANNIRTITLSICKTFLCCFERTQLDDFLFFFSKAFCFSQQRIGNDGRQTLYWGQAARRHSAMTPTSSSRGLCKCFVQLLYFLPNVPMTRSRRKPAKIWAIFYLIRRKYMTRRRWHK